MSALACFDVVSAAAAASPPSAPSGSSPTARANAAHAYTFTLLGATLVHMALHASGLIAESVSLASRSLQRRYESTVRGAFTLKRCDGREAPTYGSASHEYRARNPRNAAWMRAAEACQCATIALAACPRVTACVRTAASTFW